MPDVKETTYNFDFDLYNPDVQDFIKERSYDFWESISETTKNELRSYLADATKEGKTINQISEGLMGDVFSGLITTQDYTRARKIARTETTIALNQGAMESYKQSGVPVKKSWLTSGDEDVRVSHRACEAQGVIGMEKRFKNGLMFPGDSDGALKELVNCRCSLLPEVGETEKVLEKQDNKIVYEEESK